MLNNLGLHENNVGNLEGKLQKYLESEGVQHCYGLTIDSIDAHFEGYIIHYSYENQFDKLRTGYIEFMGRPFETHWEDVNFEGKGYI